MAATFPPFLYEEENILTTEWFFLSHLSVVAVCLPAAACLSCLSPCVVETKVFSKLHIGTVPPFSKPPAPLTPSKAHMYNTLGICQAELGGWAVHGVCVHVCVCICEYMCMWEGILDILFLWPQCVLVCIWAAFASSHAMCAFVWVITLIDAEKAQMHAAVLTIHPLISHYKHCIVCEKWL